MHIHLTDIGDPHIHVRQNQITKDETLHDTMMLNFAVPHTAAWASFALPMPNTTPSIRTGSDAIAYAHQIRRASPSALSIIMCIKAVEGFTTPEIIHDAHKHGVQAIKVYFEGVTTNANKGDAVTWDGFWKMADVWRACEELDIVVCIHPEKPGVFTLRRERMAHEAIEWLATTCPNLRIVVEHVTDRLTLALVRRLPPNVRCTITAHHLWGDLDMVIGGHLNAHAFCKPVAKEPEDREALLEAMLSGNPKFMFGSDTAPHPLEDKLYEGCAGCFTGPYCPQMIAHLLEQRIGAHPERIARIMQGFMGDFARKFYRIPATHKLVTLVRRPFKIPPILHTSTHVPIVPFMAGEELNWSLA